MFTGVGRALVGGVGFWLGRPYSHFFSSPIMISTIFQSIQSDFYHSIDELRGAAHTKLTNLENAFSFLRPAEVSFHCDICKKFDYLCCEKAYEFSSYETIHEFSIVYPYIVEAYEKQKGTCFNNFYDYLHIFEHIYPTADRYINQIHQQWLDDRQYVVEECKKLVDEDDDSNCVSQNSDIESSLELKFPDSEKPEIESIIKEIVADSFVDLVVQASDKSEKIDTKLASSTGDIHLPDDEINHWNEPSLDESMYHFESTPTRIYNATLTNLFTVGAAAKDRLQGFVENGIVTLNRYGNNVLQLRNADVNSRYPRNALFDRIRIEQERVAGLNDEQRRNDSPDEFILNPRKLAPNLRTQLQRHFGYVDEYYRDVTFNYITAGDLETFAKFALHTKEDWSTFYTKLECLEEINIQSDEVDQRNDAHSVGRVKHVARTLVNYRVTTIEIRVNRFVTSYNVLTNMPKIIDGSISLWDLIQVREIKTNIIVCKELYQQIANPSTMTLDSDKKVANTNITNYTKRNSTVNLPFNILYHNHHPIYEGTMQYAGAVRETILWNNFRSGVGFQSPGQW
jgi:hypothetical protein